MKIKVEFFLNVDQRLMNQHVAIFLNQTLPVLTRIAINETIDEIEKKIKPLLDTRIQLLKSHGAKEKQTEEGISFILENNNPKMKDFLKAAAELDTKTIDLKLKENIIIKAGQLNISGLAYDYFNHFCTFTA
jgi:hypothetical protein